MVSDYISMLSLLCVFILNETYIMLKWKLNETLKWHTTLK